MNPARLKRTKKTSQELQSELKQSRDRYYTLYHFAPTPYVTLSKEGIIFEANLRAAKLLRVPMRRLINTSFASYLTKEQTVNFQEYCNRAMKVGFHRVSELKLKNKLGNEFCAEIQGFRDGNGCLQIAIFNISERKLAEEELRALNRDLENRIRERTALVEDQTRQLQQFSFDLAHAEQSERRRLAAVIHDSLQQMLVATKMTIEMLSKECQENEKLQQYSGRAVHQLEDAIKSARVLTAELSPAILSDAGLSVALDWLARWMKDNYALEVVIQTESLMKQASPDMNALLFQAVRELLINVVKHAGVNEAFVHLSNADNHRICVSVLDHGKGFDPSVIGTTSQSFGMRSIYHRLKMLGGSLTVESSLGRGSRFKLFAPVNPLREEEIVPPKFSKKTDDHNSRQIRILVADDHQIVRQSFVSILQNEKQFEVVGQAGDGEEVIQKVLNLKPDVVIMDISMPKLNGIQATQRIRSLFPNTRVIGLSIHDSKDMAESMRHAGASAYLSKNGPIEQLIRTIHEISVSHA